jgi:DNA polymerase
MAADEATSELHAIAAGLRVYVERLVATGAVGLPAASAELARERAGVAASEVAAPPQVVTSPARPAPGAKAAPSAPAPAVSAAPAPVAAAPADLAERKQRLQVLASEVAGCTRCGLHAGRTQTVFARGEGTSGLCFVGEGPGFDEDQQGFPFVGKAGQLLDRMIAAMGFERDEVYVANIVKCRPPNNRKPELDEMAACVPYLTEQLELIAPQVIVALGATAVQGLLGTSEGITRMRGRWRLYKGRIPVMPTFHPAYLLRTPAAKREVWDDLQAVLKHMGRPVPAKR